MRNLNDTTPAPPTGTQNVKWKLDGTVSPNDISASLPASTAMLGGSVPTPPNDATKFLAGDSTWKVPSGGGGSAFNGVNAQSGASYTYLAADSGKLVTHSYATAIAGTLHRAEPYLTNWYVYVENRGVGALTITPDAGTIDGIAAIVLLTGEGVIIAFDGTNFFTMSGTVPSGVEFSANKDAASGYAGLDAGALLKAAEFPALTGDVTTTAGAVSTTVGKLLGKTLNAGIGTAGAGQDGYLIAWVNGSSDYELVAPGSVSGISATQLRGVTISTKTPLDQQPLGYSLANTDWEPLIPSFMNWYAYGLGSLNTTPVSNFNGGAAIAGTGSANVVPSGNEGGGLLLGCSTTACANDGTNTGNVGVVWQSNASTHVTRATFQWFRCRLKLSQTTAMRIFIGMGDIVASNSNGTTQYKYHDDTPLVGFIGFRYSTHAGDTKYMCQTGTGAAWTTNAETTASHVDATTAHDFAICYDGTNMTFFIDGVQVGQQSANLPAATLGLAPIVIVDNAGNASAAQFTWYSMGFGSRS